MRDYLSAWPSCATHVFMLTAWASRVAAITLSHAHVQILGQIAITGQWPLYVGEKASVISPCVLSPKMDRLNTASLE